MEYRIEHDTMGEVKVPAEHLWGAQTQRSYENFRIGTEKMPKEIVRAFAYLKKAAALANKELGTVDAKIADAIADAADDVLAGKYPDEFPLAVWQTGSGTQSNMNMNEVLAHIAMLRPGLVVHPNDHVNRSQSSNDTFPTALHIAAALAAEENLLPALGTMKQELLRLEEENRDVIKIGRTHLMDAVPLTFGQEISGWRGMLDAAEEMIREAAGHTHTLAIGGTAVGTGLNCPAGFDVRVCGILSEETGIAFSPSGNKFHALTSKDACVFLSGAMKALAADLLKIANDVRLLASGPRCGIGEIRIPENEPGSSIMPGKVNPTQCEALTMVAVQVMGNDAAIGFAASQGNFELNVFMPVIAHDLLQSANLLADAMRSFTAHCLAGLTADRAKMKENLDRSLMLVTCLTPKIGYENAAACAHLAHKEGLTLREAVLRMGYLSAEEYDEAVRPEKMV